MGDFTPAVRELSLAPNCRQPRLSWRQVRGGPGPPRAGPADLRTQRPPGHRSQLVNDLHEDRELVERRHRPLGVGFWNTAWFGVPDKRLDQRLADMDAALEAESRNPATLRRTVGMDCDLTDPHQASGSSFAASVDELARAIDAYERLGIDDLSSASNRGPSGHWTG
jgi:hypothetical protein